METSEKCGKFSFQLTKKKPQILSQMKNFFTAVRRRFSRTMSVCDDHDDDDDFFECDCE